MLFGVYEFEVFQDEDEGFYLAFPYDLPGGTQGESFDELCLMVVDWLKTKLEDFDMHDKIPPAPTFGNTPQHGGTNMVFAVQAGKETVKKVSAKEAASMLGVSQSRVTQMLAAGRLEGFRDGRNTYVTAASIEARLEERADSQPAIEERTVVPA